MSKKKLLLVGAGGFGRMVAEQAMLHTRNLLLHVTDEELLTQTGGVVQGMSGSAILQDGKIIGAVTHVLLEDPSRGYGIFIENMLSAAGLSSE